MPAQTRGQPTYMIITQALQLSSSTIIKIVTTEFAADYIVKVEQKPRRQPPVMVTNEESSRPSFCA